MNEARTGPGLSLPPGLLRCPICREPLRIDTRSASCAQRHSFDIAKGGYLNLLNAPQPGNADTAAMLAARERIQDAGLFAPLAQALTELAAGAERVLESGAGTGYYLSQLPAEIRVGLDVSTAAAKRIAKRGLAAIVADVWKPLPFTDGSFDLLLCVFAPRNLPEFSRVLASAGTLLLVTPNPGHLAAVRQRHQLLDIPADKLERLGAQQFKLESTTRLRYPIELSSEQVSDLIQMGPNAFHQQPAPATACTDQIDVTISCFRPNGT